MKLDKDEWIVVENFVEPLISKEDFETVQKMKRRNIGSCQKKYDYLLKGLVVCGDCGKMMTVRRRKCKRKNKEDSYDTYYCCSNNVRYRNGVCSLHYFREQRLNKLILKYLRERISKYANIEKMKEVCNKELNKGNLKEDLYKEKEYYENKTKTIELALKNLYIDKISSLISNKEFLELKEELENDKKYMRKKLTK